MSSLESAPPIGWSGVLAAACGRPPQARPLLSLTNAGLARLISPSPPPLSLSLSVTLSLHHPSRTIHPIQRSGWSAQTSSSPLQSVRALAASTSVVLPSGHAVQFWLTPPGDHVPMGHRLQGCPPHPGRHTARFGSCSKGARRHACMHAGEQVKERGGGRSHCLCSIDAPAAKRSLPQIQACMAGAHVSGPQPKPNPMRTAGSCRPTAPSIPHHGCLPLQSANSRAFVVWVVLPLAQGMHSLLCLQQPMCLWGKTGTLVRHTLLCRLHKSKGPRRRRIWQREKSRALARARTRTPPTHTHTHTSAHKPAGARSHKRMCACTRACLHAHARPPPHTPSNEACLPSTCRST